MARLLTHTDAVGVDGVDAIFALPVGKFVEAS